MDTQVTFENLLHELGEKSVIKSGGMDSIGPGQGLHTPLALRPHTPMPVSGTGNPPLESGSSMPNLMAPMTSRMELNIGGAPYQGYQMPMKRKRGRPRKYTTGDSPQVTVSGFGNTSLFSALAKQIAAPYTPPDKSEKRGRGRPVGSTRKQQLANLGVVLAGTGKSFTPHILTVHTGEDASSKIMQFAQHGPRAMCVLSANGAVSNVMLRQDSSSEGTVTYEGRYEILSLSGSYLPLSGEDGAKQRTGIVSVSLAGSDGRVFGGRVAGMLTAASPIQVVVGSFLLGLLKTDSKVDSPLRLTQGELSGMKTPFATQQISSRKSSVFLSLNLNGTGAGPQEGNQASPASGQSSDARPQAVGVFRPSEGWGIASHISLLGDNRRADINISLAGG
ncbi:AT-hook motif nuclear-localized protein 7 isoform X1 [Physcomitrium patens]|nr:AT-hook motif nuclear-localized protein 9-like isoform X1 [Physcomitrium patens]XP_024369643.1 AT-hook motif nuclear-localized protein 9-like isoform X1 [Physcomitrium patens]XP_024369644.1 AT-hook motif nuclear-localized protein 9-like isoform X1 [Physcomitrium patens]XP_024369645.1 AT-hook motif nuclear-localized protein 9-like isoform X1 [Physcomitrium patens]|eukprot:XP_024369642.1 AT-hook motif nuclear-localized protein 9-like isoform X1 [Physcomitrella patens]